MAVMEQELAHPISHQTKSQAQTALLEYTPEVAREMAPLYEKIKNFVRCFVYSNCISFDIHKVLFYVLFIWVPGAR